MAARSRRRKRIRLSLAGVILLDILLYVFGMVTMVILILSIHPAKKSAIDASGAEETVNIVALSVSAKTQAQMENTSAISATTEQPLETAQPTPIPAPTGD